MGSTKPPAVSNHSSMVYGNKMYLFGGSSKDSENVKMFTLDLQHFKWSEVIPNGADNRKENIPLTRDEHSCVMLNEQHMVIFGGFTFGQRTNDIYAYNFRANEWTKIDYVGDEVPEPRAGHSAVIKYDNANGDCMFIFGGKDDDNNKLNDTWKFNFKTCTWTYIETD